jgi:hypothetical protein
MSVKTSVMGNQKKWRPLYFRKSPFGWQFIYRVGTISSWLVPLLLWWQLYSRKILMLSDASPHRLYGSRGCRHGKDYI